MKADTRTKLLAAAERIVVEEGLRALTVRRVGQVAALNPTLITYHFGSVGALLQELCERNLAPLRDGWASIGEAEREDEAALERALETWLRPMLAPAAFNPRGRALIVLDEIAAHGQGEISSRLIGEMTSVAARLQARLAPLLPGLAPEELRARLRYIAGAALGPPPRVPGNPAAPGPGEELARLHRFARAALIG